jgi:AcrR family transcriptional regulator
VVEDTPPAIATRERILGAALDLFAEQGYLRTSVQAIATRVGVTKAAVHYHFTRKIDIMLFLTEPVWRDFETAIAEAERAADPRWAVIEGWLDTLLRHRKLFRTIYHDPALVSHESTYARTIALAERSMTLIAGPEPSLGARVRAAQALAVLGDPVLYFPSAPVADLRREILAGVRRVLGEPEPRTGTRERRRPGRPAALTAEGRLRARRLYAEGRSADEIAGELAVSRATVYRHLAG